MTKEEIVKLGFKQVAVYSDGGSVDLQFKDTQLIVVYRGDNKFSPSNLISFKRFIKKSLSFELLEESNIEDIDTFEKHLVNILTTKHIKLASSE